MNRLKQALLKCPCTACESERQKEMTGTVQIKPKEANLDIKQQVLNDPVFLPCFMQLR